jgi:hypothetical protein
VSGSTHVVSHAGVTCTRTVFTPGMNDSVERINPDGRSVYGVALDRRGNIFQTRHPDLILRNDLPRAVAIVSVDTSARVAQWGAPGTSPGQLTQLVVGPSSSDAMKVRGMALSSKLRPRSNSTKSWSARNFLKANLTTDASAPAPAGGRGAVTIACDDGTSVSNTGRVTSGFTKAAPVAGVRTRKFMAGCKIHRAA